MELFSVLIPLKEALENVNLKFGVLSTDLQEGPKSVSVAEFEESSKKHLIVFTFANGKFLSFGQRFDTLASKHRSVWKEAESGFVAMFGDWCNKPMYTV